MFLYIRVCVCVCVCVCVYELPKSVVNKFVTGEKWRTSSRKNEEDEPSKNNTQLWMWLVIEVKFNAVKINIA